MASATDRTVVERASKLLPCRTGPYQAISVEPQYFKIDQDGIRNTVLINRLARMAEEGRPNMEATPDLGANTGTNHAQEWSIDKERNFYAMGKSVGHENRPTGIHYTVRWY